jgi:hypothetical protein
MAQVERFFLGELSSGGRVVSFFMRDQLNLELNISFHFTVKTPERFLAWVALVKERSLSRENFTHLHVLLEGNLLPSSTRSLCCFVSSIYTWALRVESAMDISLHEVFELSMFDQESD